jgi:DNA-binding transcriptional MerR regulator
VYGEEHLHRLQAIERARSRGASLSLIAAHLSAGRPLEDDTLVDWADEAPGHEHPPSEPARWPLPGATPVLTRLDIQRDATTQAHVEELVAAGVFRSEEGRVYTGRELAQALTELQRHGLPLQVALGIAQRALRAATPVVAALQDSARTMEAAGVGRGHLGTMACYMLRHLIIQHVPDDATRRPPATEPGNGAAER